MIWPKRLIPLRKRVFLALLVLGCSSITLVILYSQGIMRPFHVLEDETIADFLVDTPGCQIPSYDPFDPSVRSYYKYMGAYKCKGLPSFLQVKPNAVVSLDQTILQLYYELQPEDVFCVYQVIYRAGIIENFTIDNEFRFGSNRTLIFDTPLHEDFVRTICTVNGTGVFGKREYVESLTLTPLKPDVEKRCEEALAKTKKGTKLPNVIFIGIDSVSRLNFLRHFPKTKKYLHEHLSPITLKGYTKVGDNTFPNLIPMFTGHYYQDYWSEEDLQTMYFDDVNLLWKEFANRGYRTFMAEDTPTLGTFNYYRNGFKKPPTDYYYRPYALSVEDSPERFEPCLHNKMEIAALHEYMKSFINTMNDTRPFFAFVFGVRLTHGIFNFAGYADEPSFQLLRYLHETGVLNNTVVVFFSDHGVRVGGILKTNIGQFESRKPFMYLLFPPWFMKRYGRIARNLKINEGRLTTPFDIYETMLDLLNFSNRRNIDEPVLSKPGISLFNEVSSHRTCEHATISPHYCTCQTQKKISVDDDRVKKAAATVVSTINQWTRRMRQKCVLLILEKINDARIYKWTKDVSSAASKFIDYLIVLTTSPSGALLESTVRCELKKDYCFVVDDVSRLNVYGTQSSCINDTVLKKFCYCLQQ